MSNAKHTPGPWFSQYDDNGFYEIGSESVSLRLAFTYGEGETDEANARLIAAAPELLAALDRLTFAAECRDNTTGDQCRLIEVKAELAAAAAHARIAIAKATGQ